jgi:hypothetical protein
VEAGLSLPAGISVQVVKNTDAHFHIVLPPAPTGELSDEALEKAVGASHCGHDFPL